MSYYFINFIYIITIKFYPQLFNKTIINIKVNKLKYLYKIK